MSDKPIEQRIRERAYQLWEQAGRPPSEHERFWQAAEAEIGREALQEQDAVLDDIRKDKDAPS